MNAIQIKMTEGLTQRQLERIERIRTKRKPKPFPYIPDDIWREIKTYLTPNYEKRLNELKLKIKEFISQKWTTRSVIAHFGRDLMRTIYPDYELLTHKAIKLVFGDKKQRKNWEKEIYPFDLPTDATRQVVAKKMVKFIEPLLKDKIPSKWRKLYIPYLPNPNPNTIYRYFVIL
jgi:hypothetical protein